MIDQVFNIPPNPDPGMLAWPYFVFADEVGVAMERLDGWYQGINGPRRQMYLVDVDGGTWVAEGEIAEADRNHMATTGEVRDWALTTGYPPGIPVSRRGRLRKEIWAAFATYGGPWPTTFRVVSVPVPADV